MQTHPSAKGLLNKSFPYYDELSCVFEKDRATEGRAETFVDVDSKNVPSEYEEFPQMDLNDMKFYSMSDHGVNMSQEDIAQPGRARDSRTGSSGSKKRRRGQPVDTIDVIKDAIDYQNDQLRLIAEWSQLAL